MTNTTRDAVREAFASLFESSPELLAKPHYLADEREYFCKGFQAGIAYRDRQLAGMCAYEVRQRHEEAIQQQLGKEG